MRFVWVDCIKVPRAGRWQKLNIQQRAKLLIRVRLYISARGREKSELYNSSACLVTRRAPAVVEVHVGRIRPLATRRSSHQLILHSTSQAPRPLDPPQPHSEPQSYPKPNLHLEQNLTAPSPKTPSAPEPHPGPGAPGLHGPRPQGSPREGSVLSGL